MADSKSNSSDAGVKAFLASVTDPQRKAECQSLLKLMKGLTKTEPVLWGASVIGFGTHTVLSPGGRKNEAYLIGFSPRKKDLSLFVMTGLSGMGELLVKLGPHKCGKTCLYVNSLAEVDQKVLKQLLTHAVRGVNGS